MLQKSIIFLISDIRKRVITEGRNKRPAGHEEPLACRVKFMQKEQQKTPRLGIVSGRNCHLAEEVFHTLAACHDMAQTTPQRLHSKERRSTPIAHRKRAAEFDGVGQKIALKAGCKTEVVRGGDAPPIALCTNNITIAAHHPMVRRIPRHELAITAGIHIVCVHIFFPSRTTAHTPKSLLAQACHLLHQRRAVAPPKRVQCKRPTTRAEQWREVRNLILEKRGAEGWSDGRKRGSHYHKSDLTKIIEKIPSDNSNISAKSSNFTPKYTFLIRKCL